jgi:S-DNA-T family DNA segregation ATPase FtsK/SpoIIIE
MSDRRWRKKIGRSDADTVPISGLSMYARVFLGMDENGCRVEIELVYRNVLIGGEPAAGSPSH